MRRTKSAKPFFSGTFGPKGSLDLSSLSSPILFGDETRFGLAAALRNTASGKSALCVFEVNDPKESEIALAAVGVPAALLIERKTDGSHLSDVHAALLKTVSSDTQFVLVGKATPMLVGFLRRLCDRMGWRSSD